MEPQQPLDNNFSDQLELNDLAVNYLKEAAKWGKFIAIVGFVMIGIFVIFALFMGAILGSTAALSDIPGGMGMMSGGMLTTTYLIVALIYFFPTLYLYRFSIRTRDAINQKSSELLTNGIEQLKSLFKFMGILMIVLIGFYALMLIIVAITAAVM